MADDLYTQWLGLKPGGNRPPDYYTLLGLPVFTRRVADIEDAARAQLDKLDRYAIHPDREKRDQCQQMMNEVAVARVILTDLGRREPYDEELAAAMGVDPPPADEGQDAGYDLNELDDSLEEGEAADKATQALLGGASVVANDARRAKQAQQAQAAEPDEPRKPVPLALILGGVGLVVVIVIVVGVVFAMRGMSDDFEQPESQAGPTTPPPAKAIVKQEEPPRPKDDFDFDERFDQGLDTTVFHYEPALGQLTASDARMGVNLVSSRPLTVVVEPTTKIKRMAHAKIDLSLAPGGTVHIEVDGGARLTLTNRFGKPSVQIPTAMDVPDSFDFNPRAVTLEMKVEKYTAEWFIDGKPAGKTPPPTPGEVPPNIRMVFAGQTGEIAQINRIQVVFKTPAE